ncbi:MAG: ParM/StbA family protein [Bacillota bacterium]
MERLIGVDLGYGFVKATDGREGFVFPSVVGDGSPHQPLRLASQEVDPTDNLRVQIGDRVYHVGTLAVRHSRMAYRSLSVTRDEGNDLLVLFLTALSLFAKEANTTFSVVTGLPPGRMHLADQFVRSVRGDHRVVRFRSANPEELFLRVDRVTVVPQPLGTYWSQVLDSRGQLLQQHPAAEARVGIIDIGFRTTDLVTVEGGEYVPELARDPGGAGVHPRRGHARGKADRRPGRRLFRAGAIRRHLPAGGDPRRRDGDRHAADRKRRAAVRRRRLPPAGHRSRRALRGHQPLRFGGKAARTGC